MSEELAGAGSGGKLAKAAGRFLVGDNQYALIAVTCHIRAAHSATEDDIEQLGEQYLTVASTYALGLGRALAERCDFGDLLLQRLSVALRSLSIRQERHRHRQ